MSSSKVNCVLNIIREHFGVVVEQVARQLIVNSSSTLKLICFFTRKPVHLVKECLKTLIQHNLVQFKTNGRDQIEYELITDRVIAMLRYSKYVLVGSYLDSKIGQYLVDAFLKNGKLTVDELIEKLNKKLSNDSTVLDKYELPKLIYDTFIKFVSQDYIVNNERSKTVPPVDFKKFHSQYKIKKEHGQQLNLDDDETDERPTKKQKTDGATTVEPANQPIWFVNNEQFDHYLRGELIAECIKLHYDDVKAGELARIIYSSASDSVSRSVIVNKAIESKTCDSVGEVDNYLKLFDQDLDKRFIYRVESTSDGGRFSVNCYNLFHHLIKETMATIVNDYYGDKSSRIFRLLLKKKYLQQKTIGELAMISVKDAKERLSTLFKDGLIKILQFTKAPDYAPMKTSFVVALDLNELCFMFRNKCFHALYSIATRRNYEYTSNRTLIEKKLLIDAVIENIKSTKDDNEIEQLNDLDQSFSSHEQAILNRYEMITRKTELCELEIEKTLFLINTFLEVQSNKDE